MQVSVLRGVGQVTVEERSVPEPGTDEVLVEVGSVGVCGSDVHYFEYGRIGRYVVDSPLVLGHEAGGVVAAVGVEVTSLQVGQRVSIEPGVPCRSCRQCLTGHYNLCPDVRFFATPPYDGAFSQFVAMPAAFVYPVPDSISDDAAGLLEPLSVGVWACRRSQLAPGSTVQGSPKRASVSPTRWSSPTVLYDIGRNPIGGPPAGSQVADLGHAARSKPSDTRPERLCARLI
jgi:L-iditol 2-dehydrogenase